MVTGKGNPANQNAKHAIAIIFFRMGKAASSVKVKWPFKSVYKCWTFGFYVYPPSLCAMWIKESHFYLFLKLLLGCPFLSPRPSQFSYIVSDVCINSISHPNWIYLNILFKRKFNDTQKGKYSPPIWLLNSVDRSCSMRGIKSISESGKFAPA